MNISTPASGLLEVLDSDPVKAEAKLDLLTRQMVRWLEWKGCLDPYNVVAESVYRALKQQSRLNGMSESDLRGFLFGIAINVAREAARKDAREVQVDDHSSAQWISRIADERQLMNRLTLADIRRILDAEDWHLLVRYATNDDRQALAAELGVTAGALRIKIHRIRELIRVALEGKRGPSE